MFDDMSIRLDTVPALDRRTDTQTDREADRQTGRQTDRIGKTVSRSAYAGMLMRD